jgi:3-oxoacyl-[acyl-carrier-protein] synthase III
MALADAFDHERVEEGDLILLVASGGGAAIAGMAVQL